MVKYEINGPVIVNHGAYQSVGKIVKVEASRLLIESSDTSRVWYDFLDNRIATYDPTRKGCIGDWGIGTKEQRESESWEARQYQATMKAFNYLMGWAISGTVTFDLAGDILLYPGIRVDVPAHGTWYITYTLAEAEGLITIEFMSLKKKFFSKKDSIRKMSEISDVLDAQIEAANKIMWEEEV